MCDWECWAVGGKCRVDIGVAWLFVLEFGGIVLVDGIEASSEGCEASICVDEESSVKII